MLRLLTISKIMLLLLKYKRSIKSAKRLLLEFEVSSDSLLLPYLILFQHSFFHYIDQSIQSHCHNTEQNNRHEKPIHLKEVKGQKDKMTIALRRKKNAEKR